MSPRRLPAEVYWRRRLLALALVIGLAWVVLRLAGGNDDEPGAEPSATRAPTATATPTLAAKVDGTVDVTLVSASRSCDPERIRITPTARSGQLTKGPVDIGLVVSSTEKTACTLDPAAADLVAVISANDTPVWDSTLCKSSLLDERVSVSPQWATLVTATWSGRGSGGSCSAKEGYATAGTYTVQVGTLGGEPGKASFSLKARPQLRPTKKAESTSKPTPKPTKTPSPKNTTKPND